MIFLRVGESMRSGRMFFRPFIKSWRACAKW
jgi:hypothetical protein